MKRNLTILLAWLALWVPANAQITLEPEDYQNPLDQTVVSFDVLSLTLAAPYLAPPAEGPDQAWDFRWIELLGPVEDAEPSLELASFPSSNNHDEQAISSPLTQGQPLNALLAERYEAGSRVELGYELETAQSFSINCGSCTEADSIRFEPTVNAYEHPDTLVKFPLADGDAWATTTYTRQFDLTLFLPTFSLSEISAQQSTTFHQVRSITRRNCTFAWLIWLSYVDSSVFGFRGVYFQRNRGEKIPKPDS